MIRLFVSFDFDIWFDHSPSPPCKIYMCELFPKLSNIWKGFCNLYLHDQWTNHGCRARFLLWRALQVVLCLCSSLFCMLLASLILLLLNVAFISLVLLSPGPHPYFSWVLLAYFPTFSPGVFIIFSFILSSLSSPTHSPPLYVCFGRKIR